MPQDHALKQAIYKAADEAFANIRKAGQCAARGETAAADDLLYHATVLIDDARDLLPEA